MIRLALRELLVRRAATAAMALGLITATVGFVVLAGTSETTQAVLTRDIAKAWPAPYDILVRPVGTQDQVEANAGLVRPNYLSGLRGGITTAQLDQVGATPGVAVAAPIAIVGFTYWPALRWIDLGPYIEPDKISFFRLSVVSRGDAGRSIYPSETMYIAASATGRVVPDWDRSKTVPGTSTLALESNLETGPSVYRCSLSEVCVAPTRCLGPRSAPLVQCGPLMSDRPGWVGFLVNYPLPILIAAIDPPSEAALAGVDHCVVEGRYLRADDAPGIVNQRGRGITGIPVLTSWEVGPVRYSSSSGAHVQAQVVPADSGVVNDLSQEYRDIPEAGDVWLRPVIEAKQPVPPGMAPGYQWTWAQVGVYDPTCLPGFSTPTGRMDAYNVPEVRTSGGDVLLPTRSLASYTNSPPLVMTTLEGAKYFANPGVDVGAPGAACISAIRIRVAGTEKPSPAAQARLARVAADIQRRTGLQVDVVRGSSPRPISIDIPAGKFGRPAMTVGEGWSAKGVAFRFARATSLANLVLFALALITSALLVAQTAYTGVRQRRRELAMLHALGWPPWRIAVLIELEGGIVGALAGAIAPVLAFLAITKVGAGIQPAPPLLAAPLAIAIALVAAAAPAAAASRVRPVAGMSLGGQIRASRPLASPADVGATNLIHAWGGEAVAAVAAMWLGASLLGAVLLLTIGFRGQLDTSVLGVTLTEHVAPYHYALVGITVVIGFLGAGEVLVLSYLERRPQLALLRSLGWPRRALASLIAGEGAVIAAAAAVLAIGTTVALGVGLAAPVRAIAFAASTAAAAAVLLTLAALLVPALMAQAIKPAEGLQAI